MTAEAASPAQLTSEDIDYAAMAHDTAQLAELVGERGECVFSWTSREGYPVGVMVAYVYQDGTFWTNCAGHKNGCGPCAPDPSQQWSSAKTATPPPSRATR